MEEQAPQTLDESSGGAAHVTCTVSNPHLTESDETLRVSEMAEKFAAMSEASSLRGTGGAEGAADEVVTFRSQPYEGESSSLKCTEMVLYAQALPNMGKHGETQRKRTQQQHQHYISISDGFNSEDSP